MTPHEHRLRVGEEMIEFFDQGRGEPVVLVHAGAFGDWFAPMGASSELDGFRIIRIRRAGYVPRSSPSAHLTLNDHAAHCALLLDELGIDTAHVCAHSSGALIGLQLALDHPHAVRSLILLEPAPAGHLAGPECQAALPDVVGPVMAAFESGEPTAAFDLFMQGVGGEHYRGVIDAALGPDGYQRAVEASAFFPDEIQAVLEWRFGPDEAARIRQPMLVVEGSETARVSKIPPESVALLAALVPQAETAVLDGASHLMPLEDPAGVGRLVAEFCSRHPSDVV